MGHCLVLELGAKSLLVFNCKLLHICAQPRVNDVMEPRFLLSGPSRPVIAIFELELGKSFGEKGWKVQRVLEHCRQLTWDIENLEAHEGVVIWWSPLLHCADVLVIPEKQHDFISCSYSYVHNANPTFDLSGWTDHSCRAKSWATSDELRSSIRSTRSRQSQPYHDHLR